jgi:hypothetical protein
MSTSPLQLNSSIGDLARAIRTRIDANSDGNIDVQEFASFLTTLATALGVTNSTTPGSGSSPAASGVGTVPVLSPSTAVSEYTPGPYRHQLIGFTPAKFDPSHPEGMYTKMIAARVFENIDVYSPNAVDEAVRQLNAQGIPAKKVGSVGDVIDFGNGLVVDVVKNKKYLEGDKSAGLWWTWLIHSPENPLSPSLTSVSAPAATSSASDATGSLDLDKVTWLHADVSDWPQTSQLTDVKVTGQKITLGHTKAGKWPTQSGIEGNPWVFVNRDGKWYGATFEWLRSGQTSKNVTADEIGPLTKKEPLASWRPQPGELVGFMVSTQARDGNRTINERSNVVMTRWPA